MYFLIIFYQTYILNKDFLIIDLNQIFEVHGAGKPTADSKALDGDVILAAQAKLEEIKGHKVIIATTNVGHLSLFVDARECRQI